MRPDDEFPKLTHDLKTELECHSGSWVGFWIQDGAKGHMELNLTFRDGDVEGGGHDRAGSFIVPSGSYDDFGLVILVKEYPCHHVRYVGTWDGEVISGTWKIGSKQTGSFEIWPEQKGYSLESFALQEVLPAGR